MIETPLLNVINKQLTFVQAANISILTCLLLQYGNIEKDFMPRFPVLIHGQKVTEFADAISWLYGRHSNGFELAISKSSREVNDLVAIFNIHLRRLLWLFIITIGFSSVLYIRPVLTCLT